MSQINNDAVLWGVIICVIGAFAVAAWLLFKAFYNATKDK